MSLIIDSPNMLVERRLIFFCTGLSAISVGMVTNFSTSSALLPGHCVMIVISVLVTSGNASMDMLEKIMMPVMTSRAVQKNTRYLFFNENASTLFMILFMRLIIEIHGLAADR